MTREDFKKKIAELDSNIIKSHSNIDSRSPHSEHILARLFLLEVFVSNLAIWLQEVE